MVPPGVYEADDGAIFVVKPTRDGMRTYAKRLIFDMDGLAFEYDRGAIYELTDADRMPLDRARVLHEEYGRCLNCGREIWAEASLEAGVGPVCRKAFKEAVA